MRHLTINPILLSEAEIESLHATAQEDGPEGPTLGKWENLTDEEMRELIEDAR